MSEAKLTPWFGASTQPVRPGVYLVRPSQHGRRLACLPYSYWNGHYWCSTAYVPAEAWARRFVGQTAYQVSAWRGILK